MIIGSQVFDYFGKKRKDTKDTKTLISANSVIVIFDKTPYSTFSITATKVSKIKTLVSSLQFIAERSWTYLSSQIVKLAIGGLQLLE